MSRLPFLAWIAALAATACSTYELWQARLEPVLMFTGICMGSLTSGTWLPFRLAVTPLLGDASELASQATLWAVPSVVVLAGLLSAYADPARTAGVGRRVAGLLTLIAVVTPLSPHYFDAEACDMVPVLTWQWFARVGEAWAAEQTLLLVAAALVLVATRAADETEPTSLAVRRAAAVTIDYLIVV
ncbi:MAG: hypothetical protein HOY71_33475, partial [Nonomuraea sp.]|nr:hypothetical protein [Nonomuraea sp.]